MADYQLGGRDVNDGWRKAIQDLIKEREAWAASGSVDTDLSELRLLELYRTHVAQC